ncbi:MAG: hypothetical protein B7X32_19350 [Microbacterium sp. 13-71-7]|nr:MAG: hypothetical protein B7X32_19350 [Microbacterium sp. 13-71-7]
MIGDDVLLVRSGTQPDLPTTMSVAVDISVVVERVREDLAEPVFVGVGSAQQGLSGLRVSATEARIAAADLAAHGKNWAIATVDSSGLSRILAEIAGSVTGRSAIAELLAPFDALGAEKARIMIDTLAAYLDTQGSLREAAQRLHLHPNAVGYRLRRIRELSSYDLGDPDLRFALQLACRIRRSLSAQVMT